VCSRAHGYSLSLSLSLSIYLSLSVPFLFLLLRKHKGVKCNTAQYFNTAQYCNVAQYSNTARNSLSPLPCLFIFFLCTLNPRVCVLMCTTSCESVGGNIPTIPRASVHLRLAATQTLNGYRSNGRRNLWRSAHVHSGSWRVIQPRFAIAIRHSP
jgi:hypothetical protein